MTILYVATDQQVPGRVGGSVHVTSVSRGLAALGHDVHVAVTRGDGPFPDDGATWIDLRPPFGARRLRWTLASRVRALAERIRPDVVIERYFNFGGEGVRAAPGGGRADAVRGERAGDRPSRLREAAHRPGAARRADAALARLAMPARRPVRYAAGGHPAGVGAGGSDCTAGVGRRHGAVHADASGDVPFQRRAAARTLVVFAGAFRAWHGAQLLVDAMRRLREHGRDDVDAVLIGDGPELPAVRQDAERIDGVTCVGPVAHEAMPACLAAADVGVAPFDVGRHPPLSSASSGRRSSCSSTWRRGCRWWRRRSIGFPNWWGTGRRASCTMRMTPPRSPARSRGFAIGVAAASRHGGARPGGARLRLGPHCERLAAAIEAAREHRRSV